mmetsp:Transcript_140804/g.259300  ORF Transcript_140804/g.259300 Transcript_140804/m.259300 type:complete len:816 (-) Transcript_140804:47-2494(-)
MIALHPILQLTPTMLTLALIFSSAVFTSADLAHVVNSCSVMPETSPSGTSLIQLARSREQAPSQQTSKVEKVNKTVQSEKAIAGLEETPPSQRDVKPSDDDSVPDKSDYEDGVATVHESVGEKAVAAQQAFAATAKAEKLAAQRATEAMGATEKASKAENRVARKAAAALDASREQTAAEQLAAKKAEEEKEARKKAAAAKRIIAQKNLAAELAAEEQAQAKMVAAEKAAAEQTAKQQALKAQEWAAKKAHAAQKAAAAQAAASKVSASVDTWDEATSNVADERKVNKASNPSAEVGVEEDLHPTVNWQSKDTLKVRSATAHRTEANLSVGNLLQLTPSLRTSARPNTQTAQEAAASDKLGSRERAKKSRAALDTATAANTTRHGTEDVERQMAAIHRVAAQRALAAQKAFAGTASAVTAAAEKAAEATEAKAKAAAALRVAVESAVAAQEAFALSAAAETTAAGKSTHGLGGKPRVSATQKTAATEAFAKTTTRKKPATVTPTEKKVENQHLAHQSSQKTREASKMAGDKREHSLIVKSGATKKVVGADVEEAKALQSFHNVVGVDGAFLLTLEREPHRAAYAESQLKAVGIFPERIPASDSRDTPQFLLAEGCNEGCTAVEAAIAHSHKRALEAARLRQETWTAILEDDAVPVLTDGMTGSRWDEEFQQIWSQVPAETKVVRLNWCLPVGEGHMISPPLGDGEMMLTKFAPPGMCTGAYIVHKDIIPRLLEVFPCNCALDCCLNWKFFESPGSDDRLLHFSVLSNLDMVGSTSLIKKADLRGLDMHGIMMQAFNHLGTTVEANARDQFLNAGL